MVHRGVIATLGVDIVRKHIVTVIDAANRRLHISSTIWMESWLAKVSSEGRIRKPPRGVVEMTATLGHLSVFLAHLRRFFVL